MAVCRACGRPLCPVCVRFRDGKTFCAAHDSAAAAATAPAEAPEFVAPRPTPVGAATGRHWTDDARLEPLPMSMRPGWPEEPLAPRVNGVAENLGIAGLVVGLLAFPFSFCCGVGGVFGLILALTGGGLGVAALIQAPRARNPESARWLGGIGVGISALALLLSLCSFAILFGGLGTTLFSIF